MKDSPLSRPTLGPLGAHRLVIEVKFGFVSPSPA